MEAKNMIDLQVIDGIIHAVHTGPHAAEIVELFGTPILPTPFSEKYGLQRAADEIRKLNPDCVVYPAGGDSCGTHYPSPCGPEFCPHKGDRLARRSNPKGWDAV